MSERKLKAWQEAGLIDVSTADKIRKWEAEHAKPLALWSIVGIAALTIGLGLISLIAANWEAIPGTIRLGIHFALMLALASWLYLKSAAHPAFREAGLFVLGALGLTFFGHIGQVYQTSSPLWQPLALWMLLFTPLFLGFGKSWPIAAGWMAGLIGTVQTFASTWFDNGDTIRATTVWGFATALPMLVIPAAAWMRARSNRPDFWRQLEQIALTYAVIGASFIIIASASNSGIWGVSDGKSQTALMTHSLTAIVAAAACYAARRDRSGQAVAGILAMAGVLNLIAFPITGNVIIPALLFLVFWIGIAAASIYASWRGVFQLAVAVIALRLIILSFELADDLLGSGFGLIIAGMLTLGIAGIAFRISRKFAPQEDAA